MSFSTLELLEEDHFDIFAGEPIAKCRNSRGRRRKTELNENLNIPVSKQDVLSKWKFKNSEIQSNPNPFTKTNPAIADVTTVLYDATDTVEHVSSIPYNKTTNEEYMSKSKNSLIDNLVTNVSKSVTTESDYRADKSFSHNSRSELHDSLIAGDQEDELRPKMSEEIFVDSESDNLVLKANLNIVNYRKSEDINSSIFKNQEKETSTLIDVENSQSLNTSPKLKFEQVLEKSLPETTETCKQKSEERLRSNMDNDSQTFTMQRRIRTASLPQPRARSIMTNEKIQDAYVSTIVMDSEEQKDLISRKDNYDISIKKKDFKMSSHPPKLTSQVLRKMSSVYSIQSEPTTVEDLNANSLRMMAFQTWYERMMRKSKQEKLEGLQKLVIETQKEREQKERTQTNQQVFNVWKEHKQKFLKETVKRKKDEEENKKRKEEEECERKKNAEKAFEVWKAKKDEFLRKKAKERSMKERNTQHSVDRQKQERTVECEQVFEAWKQKKDAILRERIKHKKRKQLLMEKKREENNRLKLQRAAEAYYQWELKKTASLDHLNFRTNSGLRSDNRPWRPPSSQAKFHHFTAR